jgi:hypothetical protein
MAVKETPAWIESESMAVVANKSLGIPGVYVVQTSGLELIRSILSLKGRRESPRAIKRFNHES